MGRNGEMKDGCYAEYLKRCQSAISGCADLDLRDSDRKRLSHFLISGLAGSLPQLMDWAVDT